MKRALFTAALLALATPSAFAQQVEITSQADRAGQIGAAETFTGTAYVAPVFGADMNDVSAGEVTFLPGARSAWHTHPGGQMLVVTHGEGWTQERGQARQTIRPGDVVWCPPGVEHWHGATDSTSLTHYAIQANVNGAAVTWGDHVSDEEYGGQP